MRTLIILLMLIAPCTAHSTPIVLDNVPSYNWYHGCSPTAGAMILGYWDLRGYDNLFSDASGWDEVRHTSNVRDEISSPAHNAKYDSNPDNPNLPEPPDTSIADFMGTSQGSLGYGGTWTSNIDDGIASYAAYKGYSFDSNYIPVEWDLFVDQVNLGNPMKVGITGHSMVGFGYEDRGEDGLWYASYNTWHEDEAVNWYNFNNVRNLASVTPFGGSPAPVPEPATMILFGVGLVGLVGSRIRKKKK